MLKVSKAEFGLVIIARTCQHAAHGTSCQLLFKFTHRLNELSLQQRRQRQLHRGGVAPRVGHEAGAPTGQQSTC
jgi:hypothetical protein